MTGADGPLARSNVRFVATVQASDKFGDIIEFRLPIIEPCLEHAEVQFLGMERGERFSFACVTLVGGFGGTTVESRIDAILVSPGPFPVRTLVGITGDANTSQLQSFPSCCKYGTGRDENALDQHVQGFDGDITRASKRELFKIPSAPVP